MNRSARHKDSDDSPAAASPLVRKAKVLLRVAVVVFAGIGLVSGLTPRLCGQIGGGRAAVLLDTESSVDKRLATIREHLAAQQWSEAVSLLRQTADQQGQTLVPILNAAGKPSIHVTVQTYCDRVLASLPSTALAEYRKRIDPQARRWYEVAAARLDEEGLKRVVREAYVSTWADDALLLLGDLAWERGELSQARSYWRELRPPEKIVPGQPATQRFYPDSEIPLAPLAARLALCSLFEGDTTRAAEEIAEFKRQFSGSRGQLAGREGNLAQILDDLTAAAPVDLGTPHQAEVPTFAGDYSRCFNLPDAPDTGGELWNVRLPRFPLGERGQPNVFGTSLNAAPVYFPVVFDRKVFVCDQHNIYAFDLFTGRPAYGESDDLPSDRERAKIFGLSAEQRGIGDEFSVAAIAGVPNCSLSIYHQRLYARLGSLTGRRDADARRMPRSYLACLDLTQEGKLLQLRDTESLGLEGSNWFFEGTPVVENGRAWVMVRRNRPRPEVRVLCFDDQLQRLLWNTRIAIGTANLSADVVELPMQLLSLADNRIFCNTNLGAIAALDASSGHVDWIYTYDHFETRSLDEWHHRQSLGPNPCVIERGLVYVAPYDARSVFALNVETGQLTWNWRPPEAPFSVRFAHAIVGVQDRTLVVAGTTLWGLDALSGVQRWPLGPGSHGRENAPWGRPVLAGRKLLFTTRDTLKSLDPVTGSAATLPDADEDKPLPHADDSGGNLTVGNGLLIVGRTSGLSVYSNRGGFRKHRRHKLAEETLPASETVRLAMLEAGEDNLETARELFALAAKQAQPGDEFEGQPLRSVARRWQFQVARQQGEQQLIAGQFEEAANSFKTLGSLADTDEQRAASILSAAMALLRAERPAKAIAQYQTILRQTSLRNARFGFRSNSKLAGEMAEQKMTQIIKQSGRGTYAEIEAQARESINTTSQFGADEDLHELWREYPHADVWRETFFHLANRALKRDDFPSALRWLKLEVEANSEQPDAAAGSLKRLAETAERCGYTSYAATCWKALERDFPQATIMADQGKIEVAKYVTQHLASSNLARSELPHRSQPLVRRWDQRLASAEFCVVPEGDAPGGRVEGCLVGADTCRYVSALTGETLWELPLAPPAWAGFAENLLLLEYPQRVSARDPATGFLIWERELPAPQAVSSSGGRRVLTDGFLLLLRDSQTVTAVRLANGKQAWSYAPLTGSLANFWCHTHGKLLIQTKDSASNLLLDVGSGRVLENTDSAVAWVDDPLPVDKQQFGIAGVRSAELTNPAQEHGRHTYPRPLSNAHSSPAWLGNEEFLYLLNDGISLMRVSAPDGLPAWLQSVRPAVAPLASPRISVVCQGSRVFTVGAGVLRAFDADAGEVLWERSLGGDAGTWQLSSSGSFLIAWPSRPSDSDSVVICSAATGECQQRLRLWNDNGTVSVSTGQARLVVTTPHRIVAYGAW